MWRFISDQKSIRFDSCMPNFTVLTEPDCVCSEVRGTIWEL